MLLVILFKFIFDTGMQVFCRNKFSNLPGDFFLKIRIGGLSSFTSQIWKQVIYLYFLICVFQQIKQILYLQLCQSMIKIK